MAQEGEAIKGLAGSPGWEEAGEMVVGAEGPLWAEQDRMGVEDQHRKVASPESRSDSQDAVHAGVLPLALRVWKQWQVNCRGLGGLRQHMSYPRLLCSSLRWREKAVLLTNILE